MSTDNKKQCDIQTLIASLDLLDQEEEVKLLFRRGTKYITNTDVYAELSDDVKLKLQNIQTMIQSLLVDEAGHAWETHWDRLRYYNGGAYFWVRFKEVNEAVLTTRSISISFPCKKV